MELLALFAGWIKGIADWMVSLLARTPILTSIYLLFLYQMRETLLSAFGGGRGLGGFFISLAILGVLASAFYYDHERMKRH